MTETIEKTIEEKIEEGTKKPEWETIGKMIEEEIKAVTEVRKEVRKEVTEEEEETKEEEVTEEETTKRIDAKCIEMLRRARNVLNYHGLNVPTRTPDVNELRSFAREFDNYVRGIVKDEDDSTLRWEREGVVMKPSLARITDAMMTSTESPELKTVVDELNESRKRPRLLPLTDVLPPPPPLSVLLSVETM